MFFPFIHGVRELDLCVHVKKPGKLPSALFGCETLEMLNLDMNLDLEVPMTFCLPNLKVIRLNSVYISDGQSMTRLVLCCPSLEDLAVKECCWKAVKVINISSPSLRRLVIDISFFEEFQRREVVFDTPNLQYLCYVDNLASRYSSSNLNALIEGHITVVVDPYRSWGTVCKSMLSLLKEMSNAHHLSLLADCMEVLQYDEFKHELPVFRNLNHLDLGFNGFNRWHKVLLEFLNCSPFLESLAFPQGLSRFGFPCVYDAHDMLTANSEPQYWNPTPAFPSCFRFHLKRIVIQRYCGQERELELVKYFLRIALVMEELVIACRDQMTIADRMSLENTLKKLPRGSMNCSIKVQ